MKDPALADDLEREFRALSERRAFGLNFERHVPEAVELPGRRVRRGDKVRILPPRGATSELTDDGLWRVLALDVRDGLRTASVVGLPNGEQTRIVPVDDLVVVAEFRDPIYPGLVSTGRVEQHAERPSHCVINAENYHALQTLLFTDAEGVDCIYIDPPYNTGNADWIYNDRHVHEDDLFRHSKWLAFMERRLVLARRLLKTTGVLVVAIGDDEHHRLRMLLDQVFGEENFLANVVWQGNVKNDARYTGAGLDYMLIYARDERAIRTVDMRWREDKPGLDEVREAGQRAWEDASGDAAAATASLRKWWRTVPADSPIKSIKHYNFVDGATGSEGRVYFGGPMMETSGNQVRNTFPVPHPGGGVCSAPRNGWRFSQATIDGMLAEGRIHFGADETTLPLKKVYLDEVSKSVVPPVFRMDRRRAGQYLRTVLGQQVFPNPKDHEVVMRWIRLVAPPDGVIVDYFGGSGTTVEAVARLNQEDGGSRRCVLVTNNEVALADASQLAKSGHRKGDPTWEAKGVHDLVTRPRLTTVATGRRPDGSVFEDAVPANIEFFTLTYEAPLRVASHREFPRIAPLLWLRAGARGSRIDDVSVGWAVSQAYGVLADLDCVDNFVHAMSEQPQASTAFIVTDEDRLFESVVKELPDHVAPVRLYESYLRNFEFAAGGDPR